MPVSRAVAFAAALSFAACAQDVRSAASPDGALVFRLFLAQPSEGRLFRLAYQLALHGKLLLDTSYLGINVHDQEPVLGENVGLTGARILHPDARHNVLLAEFMQNGSIGRRLNIEAGVWNDGVAFRYILPRSTPLENLLIEDEETEFSFAHDLRDPPRSATPLPFFTRQPAGWVGIYESGAPNYPRAELLPSDPATLITRLKTRAAIPPVAYEGTTPFTGPWRIIAVAPDRAGLTRTAIARDLLR